MLGILSKPLHLLLWLEFVFNYTWMTCNVVNKPGNREITSVENYYAEISCIQWNVRNY